MEKLKDPHVLVELESGNQLHVGSILQHRNMLFEKYSKIISYLKTLHLTPQIKADIEKIIGGKL